MNNILIVVDMQNDFVSGALGTKEAQKIVPKVAEYIRNWPGTTILTQDTHGEDYLVTPEGRALPVPHCRKLSAGWAFVQEVYDAVAMKNNVRFIEKETFGYPGWAGFENVDSVTLIGLCTDICVITNALWIKTRFPNTPVRVIKDLCAGTTPENHEAALKVMKSCQVELI